MKTMPIFCTAPREKSGKNPAWNGEVSVTAFGRPGQMGSGIRIG